MIANLVCDVDYRRSVLVKSLSGFRFQLPKCFRGDDELAAVFPACEYSRPIHGITDYVDRPHGLPSEWADRHLTEMRSIRCRR